MSNRGPVDPRLLRYAGAARGYLIVTVALGLAGTVLILAQAGLLAHALAAAARGDVAVTLAGTQTALLIVVAALVKVWMLGLLVYVTFRRPAAAVFGLVGCAAAAALALIADGLVERFGRR